MSATVLALATDAFGGCGGIAQYNRDCLSALAEAGHRIIVLPRHAPDAVDPPTRVTQLRARASRFAYSFEALLIAVRSRPDIVFCGHIFMAPLGWLAAKLAGAHLVMQMHGIEAWPRPSSLARRACESAALILNVSRYTRSRVLDWAAIPPERALALPNTVAEFFSPGDGSALREEWGLEDQKVLLTVGRMASSERYKGHDRVIAALPELLAGGHDVIYVIAGKGDDVLRLEKLAEGAGVRERVRFVGALPRERLVGAYRMANLFVMPSSGEGFGIAFLEAMACGTPALGLDIAGAQDALADGELGVLIGPNDNLAAAIARLVSKPKPAPHALADRVRAQFGREVFSSNICAAVVRLCSGASTMSATS